MAATISIGEFAQRHGVTRMTAHRWAGDGKLGPVVMRPGATVKGRRLIVSELVARGYLEPQGEPSELDRWSAYAADVLAVISRAAAEALPPEKLNQFRQLWAEIFGGGSQ